MHGLGTDDSGGVVAAVPKKGFPLASTRCLQFISLQKVKRIRSHFKFCSRFLGGGGSLGISLSIATGAGGFANQSAGNFSCNGEGLAFLRPYIENPQITPRNWP